MNLRRNRRSWSPDQKRAFAGEARRRRAAGETFKAITQDLGVLEGSLRLWMDQFPERALQRVDVIDVAAESGNLALITPDGFRVEGLDVFSAAQLLERIR